MTRPARSARWVLTRSIVLATSTAVLANGVGAVVIAVLLVVVLPTPAGTDDAIVPNLALAGGYLLLSLIVGVVTGIRRSRKRLAWLAADREPTEAERRRTIGVPWAVTRIQLLLWLVAVVLFSGVNAPRSWLLAVEVGLTVLIGGMVSCASTYLLTERFHREILARAMEGAPLRQRRGAGVAWRILLSWLLGTAMPVLGLVVLNGLAIGLEDVQRRELAVASFVLGLTGLAAGLVVMVFLARSIADPLRALRRAVVALAEGDDDVSVPVFDSTEVGVLQTGFNQMVAGLRERDRIRELFGRHVGEDVARRALEEGVALGGEVRDVAVVFVDVVGSTGLAERAEPVEVVERLNHLFGIVLDVVADADGTVTAFEGDAALCVWGAPLTHPSPATAALAAARELADRVAADEEALEVGIGVAAGPVVAGNIGARRRIEYTVIGDPVNTAARLSEVAKDRDVLVVAAAAVVSAAEAGEQACWTDAGDLVLRGRVSPTALAVPVDGVGDGAAGGAGDGAGDG